MNQRGYCNIDQLLRICAAGLLVLALVLLAGFYSVAFAMPPEAMAQEQAGRLLDMIGPQGVYAILGAIFMTRLARVFCYMGKKQAAATAIFMSALVGAATMYFYTDGATSKDILGGAAMTPVGAIATYELMKFALGVAYEKLGWEVLIIAFFFLSPRPVKRKAKDGKEIVAPPNPTLTQFFEKARLDKERQR